MQRLSKFCAIAVAVISSLFLSSCGNSTDSKVIADEGVPTNLSTSEKEDLVVGLECNYAPFNWTDTMENDYTLPIDGKANQFADGYDIQISKLIGQYENMNVVIKKMDWDTLIPSLESGEINAVIAGMTDTEERRKSIDFTDEYYRSELALIVRKENAQSGIMSEDDFKTFINGKTIESQISTVTDELIDIFATKYNAIHNKAVADFPSAALDVSNSTVFAMTAELPVATSIVGSNSNLAVVCINQNILGEDAAKLGVSIGIKKGNTELKAKLNDALGKISSTERTELMNAAISRNEGLGEMSSIAKIAYLLKNYWQTFLNGLVSTIILAVVGSVLGLVIGVLIAVGKNIKFSKDDNFAIKTGKGLLKGLCSIYSVVLRGTPMMVQALIFKFACSAFGLNWNGILTGVPIFDGWLICGLIVIVLNTGAYMGQDIQAGLNGLDVGQKEAALSLGMSKFKSFMLVVLPQALRNCLPTLANEYIINVKDSSVLNVISVTELFLSVSIATSKNYFMIEGYIIIAAIYLILTLIATGLFKLVTNKLDGKKHKVHLFRRPMKGVVGE